MSAARFTVGGSVQGVGFRWATRVEALRLGLVGTVRNLDDGAVQVDAEGDADALAELRAWLMHGPRWARVTGVDEMPREQTNAISFEIVD